jgi:hypothetical protein
MNAFASVTAAALVLAMGTGVSAAPTAAASVVAIYNTENGHHYIGAGVVIDVRGDKATIVTAAHVIRGGVDRIEMQDGGALSLDSAVNASHDDVAILTVSVPVSERATIVSAPLSTDYEQGANVKIVGHPNGDRWKTMDGSIIGFARDTGFIVRCVACAKGVSGGGIFSNDGHLLAIVSAEATMYGEADHRDLGIGFITVPTNRFHDAFAVNAATKSALARLAP